MTVILCSNIEMPSRIEVVVVFVLLGDYNRLGWPLDGKFWVVPANATTIFRIIEFVDKVKSFGVLS